MAIPINITVSDSNDEHISISVSDVIGGGGGGASASVIIFEGIVGGETSIHGTDNELTGFEEDSDLITLADFAGKMVEIVRGGQDTPRIGPNSGYTKDLASDSILLASILEGGEYLKIKTVP